MEITPQWFAGFVDGEACVRMYTYERKRTKDSTKKYRVYRVTIQIANTHLPTLKLIQNRFGGSLHELPKKSDKHKQAYVLCWAQNKAVTLLTEIEPFLVTKKEQVSVILAAWKPCNKGSQKLTPEIVEQRMQAISKVQELKRVEFLRNEVH
jgi:hypothetical protein